MKRWDEFIKKCEFEVNETNSSINNVTMRINIAGGFNGKQIFNG